MQFGFMYSVLTVEVQYLPGGAESADGRLERRRVRFVEAADQFLGAQHLDDGPNGDAGR